MTDTSDWGLLPKAVLAKLHRREWHNPARRRALLAEQRTFPIEIGLKPPTSAQASQDPNHFQTFINEWRQMPQENVVYQPRNLHRFGQLSMPVKLCIHTIEQLVNLLSEQENHSRFQQLLHHLSEQLPCPDALLDCIDALDQLPKHELEMLIKVVKQLSPKMAQGAYLRALPLTGAHSKFVEQHAHLLQHLAAALYGDHIRQLGLLAWLDCQAPPKDWLLIRPLCASTQAALAGFSVMRLPSSELISKPLPAARVLIVENEQSCLALPPLPNTIAVAGGGRNISWLSAAWLTEKQTAYWGDLDRHGLTILSEARKRRPGIRSIMMNTQTLAAFQVYITGDHTAPQTQPDNLTAAEQDSWQRLHTPTGYLRLEQEYLSHDYVLTELRKWISDGVGIG